MAVPEKILREVDKLREQIEHHNRLYYGDDAPQIPDADFDALVLRLEELEEKEREHPESSTAKQKKFINHLDSFSYRERYNNIISLNC